MKEEKPDLSGDFEETDPSNKPNEGKKTDKAKSKKLSMSKEEMARITAEIRAERKRSGTNGPL